MTFALELIKILDMEIQRLFDSVLSRRAVAFYTKKPNSKDNHIDLLEQVLDNAKFDTK
jgi:hypothetical protein